MSVTWEGFTFALEKAEQIIEELAPLHRAQWDEQGAVERPGWEFDVDYERLFSAERAGAAYTFTIRRDGALVGHILIYVNRPMYCNRRHAVAETIYLLPAVRGGLLFAFFMKWVHHVLSTVGLSEIYADTDGDMATLMESIGYKQSKQTTYCKSLKECLK